MLTLSKLNLRKQFIFLFIMVQLLLLIILGLYFNYYQKQFYLTQMEENLKNQAVLLKNQDIINFENNNNKIDSWVKKIGKKISKRITIIDEYGIVTADSDYNPEEMDNHLNRPEIQTVKELESSGVSIRKSDTLGIEMFYLAIPVKENKNIKGYIRLSKSLHDINKVITNNIRNNLIFFVFMLVITLFFVWKFTKNIINPLSQLTRVAGNLAQGNFKERIEIENSQNEIGSLAKMFNYMAAQLEGKINQISEEKNRAEAIITSMVDGLIATDINLNISMINPAARQIFQLGGKKVRDKKVIEVLRHHEIDSLLEKALAQNKIFNKEIIIQSDQKRILRCYFVPINNKEEQVFGGIIVFNDITELRKLEQMRKDFVGNVSHELRTPLTSIIGYVDTILDNEISDISTVKKFLKIIKLEADRLALLIKDLLNLSKLESKNSYVLRAGNLNQVINKTVLILQDKALKKNIDIKKEVENNLLVYMVPEQIEQVMINLIDNAVKYTSEGGFIEVKAYSLEEKVVVEVQDNGIGISSEDQQRIFERFYRIDKARSRSLGGTGIGLSIVKHILKNHENKIEVESELEKGSTFRFYLNKVE